MKMRSAFRSLAAAAVAGAFAFAGPAAAQKKVKIGFITTFSGPQGVMGQYMKESVELAIEHLGGKVGGLPVEVIYRDDQVKPDVGVQAAEELLKRDQVDIVSGIIWSNVMLAVVPVVTGAGKIMVGTNAGASPLAGSQCNELYFSASWNNDQSPEALGKYLQDKGISELRSKNPKAVFVFYPGGMGIQFVKQYVQAGLRHQIPIYSVFTVDEPTL